MSHEYSRTPEVGLTPARSRATQQNGTEPAFRNGEAS
jgi:hypothetical protein